MLLCSKLSVLCLAVVLLCGTSMGERSDLPLLSSNPDTKHWGYLQGFDVLSQEEQNAMHKVFDDAVKNGLTVARIFATWEGVVNDEGMEDIKRVLKENHQRGLKTFVSVTAIDSDGLNDVPSQFRDESTASGLAFPWSSSEVVGAYQEMLNELLPLCEKVGCCLE